MASVATEAAIVTFRYRMKSTNRNTWLKSKKTFTTFEGAYDAAKFAATRYALHMRHRVVFDVLGEVEELELS